MLEIVLSDFIDWLILNGLFTFIDDQSQAPPVVVTRQKTTPTRKYRKADTYNDTERVRLTKQKKTKKNTESNKWSYSSK